MSLHDKYDISQTIIDYPTSFNLIDNTDVPDLRNIKYKSSTDHLNCPICQQPFMNPLTTICGHTFCKECIYECFKMAKTGSGSCDSGYCPLDRTPLDSKNINDLFPTPLIITNLIDDLKVFCLNNERGCEWIGSRWELEHHVLEACPYTGVKCNGIRRYTENISQDDDESKSVEDNCSTIVERRYFKDCDFGDCVHEKFDCEFCKQKLTKISYSNHLEKDCLFNYKTCELCENDMIPLKNMTKHQENCIKLGKVKCPAHEIGCKWIGNNETSLEIHLQNNNCQLSHFLPYYTNMNEKLNSLALENDFLQKQINKILDSIIQGKITNLGYNDTIEEINRFENIEDQDKLIYLNFEIDRLKYEINDKLIPFMNKNKMNDQQNIMNGLMNDNYVMKEDMNVQRMMINSLRKQLQFLLFSRNRPMSATTPNTMLHSVDDLVGDIYDVSRSSSEERLNLKL